MWCLYSHKYTKYKYQNTQICHYTIIDICSSIPFYTHKHMYMCIHIQSYIHVYILTFKRMFERAQIRNLHTYASPTWCRPSVYVLVVQGSKAPQTTITTNIWYKYVHTKLYTTQFQSRHTLTFVYTCVLTCHVCTCKNTPMHIAQMCKVVHNTQQTMWDICIHISLNTLVHVHHIKIFRKHDVFFWRRKHICGALGGLRLKWHWPNILTYFQSTIWHTLVAKFNMMCHFWYFLRVPRKTSPPTTVKPWKILITWTYHAAPQGVAVASSDFKVWQCKL